MGLPAKRPGNIRTGSAGTANDNTKTRRADTLESGLKSGQTGPVTARPPKHAATKHSSVDAPRSLWLNPGP